MKLSPRSLITDPYRELNRQMHAAARGFGHSGRKHAAAIMDWAGQTGCADILDYGCGAGTLKQALEQRGWAGKVREYDPAIAGRERSPKACDLVVCTDVLEHVEPDCLNAVLGHQRALARRAGYLCIACQPSHKFLADGRNAHLMVRPADFWMQVLRAFGWRIVTRLDRFNDEGLADVTFAMRIGY